MDQQIDLVSSHDGQKGHQRCCSDDESMKVNARLQLFPYCIVWTPLPLIGWFFPFVGHMGICRSDGTILDFAASYFVNVGEFAFGAPSRYVQFDPVTRVRHQRSENTILRMCRSAGSI